MWAVGALLVLASLGSTTVELTAPSTTHQEEQPRTKIEDAEQARALQELFDECESIAYGDAHFEGYVRLRRANGDLPLVPVFRIEAPTWIYGKDQPPTLRFVDLANKLRAGRPQPVLVFLRYGDGWKKQVFEDDPGRHWSRLRELEIAPAMWGGCFRLEDAVREERLKLVHETIADRTPTIRGSLYNYGPDSYHVFIDSTRKASCSTCRTSRVLSEAEWSLIWGTFEETRFTELPRRIGPPSLGMHGDSRGLVVSTRKARYVAGQAVGDESTPDDEELRFSRLWDLVVSHCEHPR